MTKLRAIIIIAPPQAGLALDLVVLPNPHVRGSRARFRSESTPHAIREGKPADTVYIIESGFHRIYGGRPPCLRLYAFRRDRAVGNAEIQVVFTGTSLLEKEEALRGGGGGE